MKILKLETKLELLKVRNGIFLDSFSNSNSSYKRNLITGEIFLKEIIKHHTGSKGKWTFINNLIFFSTE